MKGTTKDISRILAQTDMLLIGIGEEFEDSALLKRDSRYVETRRRIEEDGLQWLLPYLDTFFLEKNESGVKAAFENLLELVQDKDYFIVSTCMNGYLKKSGFPNERVVEPCGTYALLQCGDGCPESLCEITQEQLCAIDGCIRGETAWETLFLGSCPKCGGRMILNNIYADTYAEEGYREQWTAYTGWLQNSLHKKIAIWELGAGMKYPSVIRWPFEKIAFYNQKAEFMRVHENLFQLTEELAQKGYSIPENAVRLLSSKNRISGDV